MPWRAMSACLSVIHPFQVFLCLGVHADFLTQFDEDGNANLEAGFGGHILRGTLDSITLDRFLGLGNGKDDLAGYLDVEDLLLPERTAVCIPVLHDVLVVGERRHGNLNLLICLGEHEVEILAIVKQILAVIVSDNDVLGIVLGFHRLAQRLACGGTFQLETHERASFSGIDELAFDAYKRLPFDKQRCAFFDLTCFDHVCCSSDIPKI